RSQRLRAGHRRSKSEGQKEKQIKRFSRRSEAEFSSGDTEGGQAAGQADAVWRLSAISGECGKIRA
ncbi:hypothetical protein, partial [Rhodococcus sp. APC 3903]|uniref:hypothetical protein n=1 Tax=Rhodococcus sp. APC 3903 TaxID=3035193 RepID=UPI0025B4D7FB